MAPQQPEHFEDSEEPADRSAWPIVAIVCLGFVLGITLLVVAIVTGP